MTVQTPHAFVMDLGIEKTVISPFEQGVATWVDTAGNRSYEENEIIKGKDRRERTIIVGQFFFHQNFPLISLITFDLSTVDPGCDPLFERGDCGLYDPRLQS